MSSYYPIYQVYNMKISSTIIKTFHINITLKRKNKKSFFLEITTQPE